MALQSQTNTVTFDMKAWRLLHWPESGWRYIGQVTQTVHGSGNSSQSAFTIKQVATGSRGWRGPVAYNSRARGGFRLRFWEHFGGTAANKSWTNIRPASRLITQMSRCLYWAEIRHWNKEYYRLGSQSISSSSRKGKGVHLSCREFKLPSRDQLDNSLWSKST